MRITSQEMEIYGIFQRHKHRTYSALDIARIIYGCETDALMLRHKVDSMCWGLARKGFIQETGDNRYKYRRLTI